MLSGTAASLQISYVTISSKFIKGAGIRGKGTVPQKIAGAGYRQVCACSQMLPAAKEQANRECVPYVFEAVFNGPWHVLKPMSGRNSHSRA